MECDFLSSHHRNPGSVQENGTTLSRQNWSGVGKKRADKLSSFKMLSKPRSVLQSTGASFLSFVRKHKRY